MNIDEQVSQNDSLGRKQGLRKNHPFWWEGSYKNHFMHGPWKWWNENGRLSSEGNYERGIQEGEMINYEY